MDERIYLHYTKAELDRNFDQRIWASNAEEVIARFSARSRGIYTQFAHRADVRYGRSESEVLDLFLGSSGAPILIFIHGGAWRTFSKSDVAFVAASFVPAGMHTVVLDFANLPGVKMREMVDQVRRGVEWVYRNASTFGGDPHRIFAAGHSSGAHLTAMALITDWAARSLPKDIIKAACCVSGPYDLEPAMLSSRASYLCLTAQQVHEFSPTRHIERIPCPVLVAYAEKDTDEFRRQSRDFATALDHFGRLFKRVELPHMNHFEVMESFGMTGSQLIRETLVLTAQKVVV
jgi:arylformamidase